ncbi:hypothetical protein EYF80_007255 [Liparis tanakae]|uniref:Uncharacterized protein n=1 Tax=Liparis tanakae TaxID=230148 RepID=A0A4Z2IWS7_9TELE|nr:hypothetical protein EYF80_007255 [Liparis tanakae]
MHSSNTCSWTNAERNPKETEQRSTGNSPSPPTRFCGSSFPSCEPAIHRLFEVRALQRCEVEVKAKDAQKGQSWDGFEWHEKRRKRGDVSNNGLTTSKRQRIGTAIVERSHKRSTVSHARREAKTSRSPGHVA